MSDEDAFWRAIGANPADQLPRLVFADWLDERPGSVRCGECEGDGDVWDDGGYKYATRKVVTCRTCSATGYVSNGNAELAAALRATSAYWPMTEANASTPFVRGRAHGVNFWWYCGGPHGQGVLPAELYRVLSGEGSVWREASQNWLYTTPEAAIRDLCAAWVKLNHQGASG